MAFLPVAANAITPEISSVVSECSLDPGGCSSAISKFIVNTDLEGDELDTNLGLLALSLVDQIEGIPLKEDGDDGALGYIVALEFVASWFRENDRLALAEKIDELRNDIGLKRGILPSPN